MKMLLEAIERNWLIWILAALSIGLAPFTPEPHIWSKLNWVMGGGSGMKAMDWFDLVLHGTPWLLLFTALIYKMAKLM